MKSSETETSGGEQPPKRAEVRRETTLDPALADRLADEAQVLIVHLDADGRVQYVNPEFEQLTGHAALDVIGSDWFETILPDRHAAAARAAFADGIAGLAPDDRSAHGKVVTSTGDELSIEWFSRRLHHVGGDVVGILSIGVDITKRVQRDRDLRLSEERLDVAQRIARVATWERDRTVRTTWFSDQIGDLLRLPPEQITGTTTLSRAHPDDAPVLRELFERSRSEPGPFEITLRIETGTGEYRWFVQRWTTEFDEDGTPRMSRGTLQDIHERHLAELELRNFRSTLDQTLDAVFIFDADTLRFTYANRGALEQTGYDLERILKLHPFDISGDHDEVAFRSLVDPLTSGADDRLTFETSHVHRLGHRIPVEVRLQFVCNDGQPPTFIAVVHDLTERRRTEQLLRDININLEAKVAERTAELARSERDLRRAQEIAHIGQYSCGRHGEDWICSDEVYRLFDADPAVDVLDRPYLEARLVETDVVLWTEATARVVDTGKVAWFDFRVRRPDGSIRWLHNEITLDHTEPGDAIRLRGTLQDVSDRKRVEAALIDARNEAERANLAKSEFLSHMSHELRTPLNAVIGFAQVLDDGTLRPEHQEYVHEIKRAGDHLLDMVNELLDLTQIEAGTIAFDPRPLEIEDVVEACVASVRALARERRIDITVDIAAATVMADPVRLRQVLLNLLSNAIKYNHEAGRIAVAGEAGRSGYRLAVSDTGSGMSDDAIQGLFTPFSRLEASRSSVQGTGIGLALSKQLVEAMGGRIGVMSTIGEGSEFWIELPVGAGDDDRAPDAHHGDGRRTRVLCVESNPSNLLLLERTLGRDETIEVLTAEDGDAALVLARSEQPDVILLHLGLVGIDGYEVMHRLRADPTTAEIPVVAATGGRSAAELERIEHAGFVGFVGKPYSAYDLWAAIRNAIASVG